MNGYFDSTYFDAAYFATDGAETQPTPPAGGGRGRYQPMSVPIVRPTDQDGEDLLFWIL